MNGVRSTELLAYCCYRFVLSHPSVDVCISDAQNLEQTRQALRVLELGPMTEKGLAWMRSVGDYIYFKRSE